MASLHQGRSRRPQNVFVVVAGTGNTGAMEPKIGQILRDARWSAGLSQRALGDLASTSAAAVNRYERGLVEPGFSTFSRLLDACGVTLTLATRPRVIDPTIAEEVRLSRQRPLEERVRDLKRLDQMIKSARHVA